MQLNLDDVPVVNNEVAQRFEAAFHGYLALITYRRFPGQIVFDHAEVPAPLERKGLAAKLTRTGLDFARANHLRVVPLCPYVSNYLRRHVEFQDLVSPDELKRILSRSADIPNR